MINGKRLISSVLFFPLTLSADVLDSGVCIANPPSVELPEASALNELVVKNPDKRISYSQSHGYDDGNVASDVPQIIENESRAKAYVSDINGDGKEDIVIQSVFEWVRKIQSFPVTIIDDVDGGSIVYDKYASAVCFSGEYYNGWPVLIDIRESRVESFYGVYRFEGGAYSHVSDYSINSPYGNRIRQAIGQDAGHFIWHTSGW